MRHLVLAILLFAPIFAIAEPPTEDQVACHGVGITTLKLCAAEGVPTIKTDADKAFVRDVCVGSGYKSEAACLDEKVWKKYEAEGVCEGSGLFTHDAITSAGKEVIAKLPAAERKERTIQVENWAGAAGMRIMRYCQKLQEREAGSTSL